MTQAPANGQTVHLTYSPRAVSFLATLASVCIVALVVAVIWMATDLENAQERSNSHHAVFCTYLMQVKDLAPSLPRLGAAWQNAAQTAYAGEGC